MDQWTNVSGDNPDFQKDELEEEYNNKNNTIAIIILTLIKHKPIARHYPERLP